MPPYKSKSKTGGECTDPLTLTRRQKQIDYGKVTAGYRNYLATYPKNKRTSRQPGTPDKFQVCSRRSFDGQIRIWRLLLHAYDNLNVVRKIDFPVQDNESKEVKVEVDVNQNHEDSTYYQNSS